ncbi:hypothetical protein [Alcanivorax sp. 1008]|uniref:hypothetical protein n=1 Tax=Alcanivorax sp. 1008 TaxID=2816853 RepID=UPI001DB5F7FA|nr:hypothetical protein [Alcanivorax sp. 1008]MCC1498182.1 hypothetical protein [Alcanivorax sp. 1008]
MSTNQDDKDILKRLKALEEENKRLRAAQNNEGAKLIVTEGDYKGYPILTFEGSVRRFTLGLTKLKALKEAWPKVEDFLRRHSNGEEDDDIRI